MHLSIREAAALLEKSPRALRAQVARGDLPAVKRNGRWRIDRGDLPLTEKQRLTLQKKADRVRRTVEDALPSRMVAAHGQRSRSLADLDAFRQGAGRSRVVEGTTRSPAQGTDSQDSLLPRSPRRVGLSHPPEGLQPLPRVFRRIDSRVREVVMATGDPPSGVDLERSMAACAGVALF